MNIPSHHLCCVSIVVALTISLSQCKIQESRSIDSDLRKFFDPKCAVLAGRDTPVWLEWPDENNKTGYRRLKAGIVGQAVDWWLSGGYDRTAVYKRSIINETNINLTDSNNASAEVLYPSILVVMDYNTPWPTELSAQKELMMKKILYALAFWNSVDLRLRQIQTPKIRLRVAGIVIGRDKKNTADLSSGSPFAVLDLKKELPLLINHWDSIRSSDENSTRDFRYGAYDIVAALTDSLTEEFSHIAGVSTTGPPCDSSNKNKLNGLIVHDDFTFRGVQMAVNHISKILGAEGKETRHWDSKDLNLIKTVLATGGNCMAKPKESYPPGDKIGIILPAQIIFTSNICKSRGLFDGTVCWKEISCENLICSSDVTGSPCQDVGATPDGTWCGTGKMCFDGQCINKIFLKFKQCKSDEKFH